MRAGETLRMLAQLKDKEKACEALVKKGSDLFILWELALEENEEALAPEIESGIKELTAQVEQAEMEALLSGPYDGASAILSLHAGAGGTEAQDWTQILLRMYTRWAEDHRFAVELWDSLLGEEAGLKSATLHVKGPNAYGYLKAEKGVHRLVRISPFDAGRRRHTSFASVDVLPEVDQKIDVEINPDDLRIDTFRASGAGGQYVNKTDSAVRITHLPTGIVVQCQNERSQHANREAALRYLKAKLFALKKAEQEKERATLRGEQQEIAWGSQIRSYVFQPYQLVKDHRTGLETGNVEAVLDGALDLFIKAYLQQEARRLALAGTH